MQDGKKNKKHMSTFTIDSIMGNRKDTKSTERRLQTADGFLVNANKAEVEYQHFRTKVMLSRGGHENRHMSSKQGKILENHDITSPVTKFPDLVWGLTSSAFIDPRSPLTPLFRAWPNSRNWQSTLHDLLSYHYHRFSSNRPTYYTFAPRYGDQSAGIWHSPLRKSKRIRTAFSPSQLLRLEHAFERSHYLVGQQRADLATKLSLTETQVKVWFQNRRTKYKRSQEEIHILDHSSRDQFVELRHDEKNENYLQSDLDVLR